MKRTAVVLLFVLIITYGASAQLVIEELPPMQSGRISAIGGPHVAAGDDLTTLFLNPAGFRSADPELSLAEITISAAGPIFTIGNLIQSVLSGADIATLMSTPWVLDLITGLHAGTVLNGPISFGYVGNGLGFGIFNTTGLTFDTVGTIPTVSTVMSENLTFLGGYAFRVPIPEEAGMKLDLGLMLKAFVQGEVNFSASILSLLGLLGDPSIDTILSQPFDLVVGAGLDVGIRYSIADVITFGIVGRNLPTFTMRSPYASVNSFMAGGTAVPVTGYVPIDLSGGIMFSPSLGFFDRFISGVKIFLDYSDILDFVTHPDTARNPFLHIGAGAEITLLEIMALRGGFYDGYFSAGFGLDLSIVRIDLSMFGRELSGEPGVLPSYNVLLGLLFRI